MLDNVSWVSLGEDVLENCDLFKACQELVENPTEMQSLACCSGTCKSGTCACLI